MADPRSALAVRRPKVSVPRRIDRAVERPRLLRDLSAPPFDPAREDGAGRGVPAVLLACAPAGYGKTTMLADLVESQRAAGVPVAWVTCDRDDDGTAFWGAVILAATEAAPESATVLAGLGAPTGPTDSTFVANLVSVLGAEVPGLLLVLDDVHEARSREVLDGIQHLVEWADGRVRVALGCRFEPPIGLHRLRLTGRLHEVRAAQLAFTAEEADAFWERHDIGLDPEQRATLLRLTEGWPAALRLAALSLEHGDDPAVFVAEFSGADRPVADYLAGEVLVRLPDEVVDFLLRTCVVEDLSVELATLLSGRDDAASILDDLGQRNALVSALDRSGTWFRYHALLRTYLVAALRRRDPHQASALRRTAALWFLEQRQPTGALEMASAAGDDELVLDILRGHGLGLLLAGNAGAVRRALGPLPPSTDRHPVVLVHRALLAVDAGDLVAADEALAVLAAVPDDGADARVSALRDAAALHRARLAGDLTHAHRSGLLQEGAAQVAPELDPDVRLLVLADRGAVRLFEGDHHGARHDLNRAIELARAAGLHSVQLYCKNLVAGTHVAESDFERGRTAAEKAVAFATARGWDRSPSLAYSYILLGWVSFQTLDPEEAATWAAMSVDVIEATIDVEIEGAARTGEAIIAFDDPQQRRPALERLERTTAWLGERGASPALVALAAAHELRMCLSLGEWHRAEEAVDRAHRRLGTVGDVGVLQAQLAVAKGRPADARRLLQPVLHDEVHPLRGTALTAAWLLEALLAERADRRPASTEALLKALETAASTNSIRPFFDAGAEVHALLGQLRGRAGPHEQVLASVLAGIERVVAWQAAASSTALPLGTTAAPSGGWLTERELVVLRDLPSMMTLGEIAGAQGISLNTVKTHVRSIYSKLGASTRREAIAVARGLGLL